MAEHPPAARRRIVRQLRDGTHPSGLIDEARSIIDPGHAAITLLEIADDERTPADKAAALIEDATRLLQQVDRPGRMAETWSDALEVADENRGPAVARAVAQLRETAVRTVCSMPDGQWTTDAINALASLVDDEDAERLLERALHNRGGEAASSKQLLIWHAGLAPLITAKAPAEVAAAALRTMAGSADSLGPALASAWAIEEGPPRHEALRVLIWGLDDQDAIAAVAASCRDRSDHDRAIVLTVVGGRLDRLGADGAAAFASAADALTRLDGKPAVKAHRKLAEAMQRSGLTPPPAPAATDAAPKAQDTKPAPVAAGPRHVLALVDGYTGGLAPPHLRAVARAAPLCIAFDLDLCLMGFPTTDAGQLVDLVEAETHVGEGAGYARRLWQDGRLTLMPLESGVPNAWPGTPVATTPQPDGSVPLEGIPGPLCLLVGLGKQGLPKRMLNVVPHHHELTGQGISMETATAMGILADRLGRLPR